MNSLPETLLTAHREDRLAHAYLFYGLPVDRFGDRVLEFFQLIGCPTEGRSHEDCLECKQIKSLAHPDLVAFGDDEKIDVATVREKIVERASLTPARARTSMFWLNDTSRLTESASNALLKVLEEPPGETVFVLTARSRWECLPTIRSRCQWIRFTPEASFSSDPGEALEHFWPESPPDPEQVEKWRKLLVGGLTSDSLDWSRQKARQFLSFLIACVHQCYTNSEPDEKYEKLFEKLDLSYRIVGPVLKRLSELEQGGQPLLLVNSLLEEIYYPEERQEWLDVI